MIPFCRSRCYLKQPFGNMFRPHGLWHIQLDLNQKIGPNFEKWHEIHAAWEILNAITSFLLPIIPWCRRCYWNRLKLGPIFQALSLKTRLNNRSRLALLLDWNLNCGTRSMQSEQSWIRKFLCCCQWSLNVVGVIWNSLSESCFYILVGISIVSNQHKLYRNLNNGTSSMHAEQFWMRLLLFFSRMISLCRRFSEIDKNSGSFSSTVSEDLTKCPIRIGSSSIFRCMRTSMLLETKYSVRCFRSYINNLLFWKQYGSVLLSF
jgi:hypothetical protein